MSSKDSDCGPDVDVQVGEKRIRIDIAPVEWIIIAIAAVIIAFILR